MFLLFSSGYCPHKWFSFRVTDDISWIKYKNYDDDNDDDNGDNNNNLITINMLTRRDIKEHEKT
jgi:hypothetical protein